MSLVSQEGKLLAHPHAARSALEKFGSLVFGASVPEMLYQTTRKKALTKSTLLHSSKIDLVFVRADETS